MATLTKFGHIFQFGSCAKIAGPMRCKVGSGRGVGAPKLVASAVGQKLGAHAIVSGSSSSASGPGRSAGLRTSWVRRIGGERTMSVAAMMVTLVSSRNGEHDARSEGERWLNCRLVALLSARIGSLGARAISVRLHLFGVRCSASSAPRPSVSLAARDNVASMLGQEAAPHKHTPSCYASSLASSASFFARARLLLCGACAANSRAPLPLPVCIWRGPPFIHSLAARLVAAQPPSPRQNSDGRPLSSCFSPRAISPVAPVVGASS